MCNIARLIENGFPGLVVIVSRLRFHNHFGPGVGYLCAFQDRTDGLSALCGGALAELLTMLDPDVLHGFQVLAADAFRECALARRDHFFFPKAIPHDPQLAKGRRYPGARRRPWAGQVGFRDPGKEVDGVIEGLAHRIE